MSAEEGEQAEAEKSEKDSQRMEELLAQERKRSEEFLTKVKYLQADFENYRKRMEKEAKDMQESSVRVLVFRLLSAVDELELALANAKKTDQKGPLLEGIKMVQRNLVSSLGAEGLKRIESVGRPFDPKLHEAVEKVQGSAKQDTVVEEVRSGYILRGRVLRPSMVKVELASKGAGQEESTNE